MFVLIVETCGNHGVVRQVAFENAVAHFPLQRVIIAIGLAVTVSQYGAPAQASIERQGAAHIDVAVVVVMAGSADAGPGLPVGSRPLADHVDRGRRVARAGGQACGAAYDLDAVVNDGVGI